MEEEKLLKRKKRATAEQNTELLVTVLEKLGRLYHSQERYDEALEAYEEERNLCISLGKSMQVGVVNRWVGEIYCELGDYNESLEKLRLYLNIAAAENNMIEMQRALATIGRTYYLKSLSVSTSDEALLKRSLSEAREAYVSSLKICEKLNNINRYELMQMRSRLLQNMGLVFEVEGEFEKAVEHIEKAISINKRANLHEDLFKCYTSLASLYEKQGNLTMSLKCYDLASEVGELLPDKTHLSEALCSKAGVYFNMSNYRAAKNTLIKAYKICKTTCDEKSLVERDLKLAHVLCESEEKLIKVADDDFNEKKRLNEIMGDSCCSVKNFKQAVVHYKKMFECCEALGLCGKDLLPALFSLSQTYRDAGMYEESMKFVQKELEMCEDNPEEACKKSLNIVHLLCLKKASYGEIMDNLKKSHEYALIAQSEKLEMKVLKCMLKIQEKYECINDANETRNKLEVIKSDKSPSFSNDSSDEEEDDVATPDIVNDISMSDILDEFETSTDDSTRTRQLRKQPQGVIIRRNEKGETQLQVACIAGNIQRVKQLIDLKHPVNVRDNGGWTPLHEVCNFGHIELVELLLDHGANINDPGGSTCQGLTPLHDACANGHLRIVEILLDRGAYIDVRTNDNKTPLDCLMEWASTESLSSENIGLFESIKDRLKTGLEKAGLNTEIVNIPIEHHNIKESNHREKRRKENDEYSRDEKTHRRKRSWSVVSPGHSCSGSRIRGFSDEVHDEFEENDSDDDKDNDHLIFQPPLLEEDEEAPALEYENVMKALRKKVIQEPTKKFNEIDKPGALIKDSDFVDDWLIDDMKDHMRPSKKRRIRDNESRGAKLIGTLRRDVVINEEDSHWGHESNHREHPGMVIEELSSDVEDNTDNRDKEFSHQSCEKKSIRHQQNSLLNLGFSSSTPVIISPQSETLNYIVDKEVHIPTIKVHIENTSLIVPVPTNDSAVPLTIDWLAKEAAKRFLKLEGREPILVLLTKDRAALATDDPITVIYDSKEVIAQVNGWKVVSVMQRYVDACNTSNSVCVPEIQNCLQGYDVTKRINLTNCSFYFDTLKPLIQSLQNEHCLKELLLKGNALMDDGVQLFSAIEGLSQLEVLDLSCNNISSTGLASLCNFITHCQNLKILDLGYNDFEDGWLESIAYILNMSKSLISLCLQSTGLRYEECGSLAENNVPLLNSHSLQVLDISYNPLGGVGVNYFLKQMNATRVRKLCVAGTILANSKILPNIVEFFRRSNPVNLRYLDISDCDVPDHELMELLGCLQGAEHLSTLVLRNNSALSSLSLNALASLPKVPNSLDLCGCYGIFSSYEDDSGHSLLDNTFLKKLNSLCITLNDTNFEYLPKHWREEMKDRWKMSWGQCAEVLIGPSGLLKLSAMKIEGQED